MNDIISYVSAMSSTELSYLFVVLFMFTLAIIDLTVGVSNDAVNFLSSAVGSKAAKIKHVLIVAAVGIFVGASFSSGMMDVARHGIFDPSFFTFENVMCVYLAVVITASKICESCSSGVRPLLFSRSFGVTTDRSKRLPTRTMKNSSRLPVKMERKRSRSMSGTEGSAASSMTRLLNLSQDNSRFCV